MNIFICDNLKELRKKRNNTQEELAEFLTVSISAVSKWERGECYPDIELLPAIAMYYNVSVDDLLGVGKIQIEKKIAEYHERADKYERLGETENVKSVWIEAFKEFPNNQRILMQYVMWGLSDECVDEKIKIAERLLQEAPDFRNWAVRTLSGLYARMGNEEKAMEYARKMPIMEHCDSIMVSKLLKGAELVEHIQDFFKIEIVTIANWQLRDMTWRGDFNNDEQRKVCQRSLKLYEWLYEDGDYGFYNTDVATIYADLAIFDANDKNANGVIENLSRMADCAIDFLSPESFQHTSFLVNRLHHNGEHKGYSNSTDNEAMTRLKFMKRDCFDFCREDGRFKAIEEKLSEYAGNR